MCGSLTSAYGCMRSSQHSKTHQLWLPLRLIVLCCCLSHCLCWCAAFAVAAVAGGVRRVGALCGTQKVCLTVCSRQQTHCCRPLLALYTPWSVLLPGSMTYCRNVPNESEGSQHTRWLKQAPLVVACCCTLWLGGCTSSRVCNEVARRPHRDRGTAVLGNTHYLVAQLAVTMQALMLLRIRRAHTHKYATAPGPALLQEGQQPCKLLP